MKKRFKIIIYNFDPKTKELESTDTLTTRPMNETEFESVLKSRTASLKNACYQVKR